MTQPAHRPEPSGSQCLLVAGERLVEALGRGDSDEIDACLAARAAAIAGLAGQRLDPAVVAKLREADRGLLDWVGQQRAAVLAELRQLVRVRDGYVESLGPGRDRTAHFIDRQA